jgi:hypothetical protein
MGRIFTRGTQNGKTDQSSKGDQGGNGLGGLAKDFAKADGLYFVDIGELNGSGVTGGALLAVNDMNTPGDLLDDTLTVFIAAKGLEPNQVHIQHIHGFSGEGAAEAVTPPPSADTDGDGFIELAEGLPFYGEILLNLSSRRVPVWRASPPRPTARSSSARPTTCTPTAPTPTMAATLRATSSRTSPISRNTRSSCTA